MLFYWDKKLFLFIITWCSVHTKGEKNKMKKFLTLIITFALVLTSGIALTACGGGKDPNADKTVTGIAIASEPTKTTYTKGELLNLAGGKITVTYDDETISELAMTASGVTNSGYDKNTVGEQSITITYKTKTAQFTVTVVDNGGGGENPGKTVSSIAVKTMPAKTVYNVMELLDLTGCVITVTYSDSSTQDISLPNGSVQVTGFTSNTAGTKTLTVTYGNKTATFTVTVSKPPVGGTPQIPSFAQTAPASAAEMVSRLKANEYNNAAQWVTPDFGLVTVGGNHNDHNLAVTAVEFATSQEAVTNFEILYENPARMSYAGIGNFTSVCVQGTKVSYTQADGTKIFATVVGNWLIYGASPNQ